MLSPRAFAAAADGLMRALRESGLGVRFRDTWVGGLMLMDDLVLLASSRAELSEMLAVVYTWCHQNRFEVAEKKTHVFARLAAGGSEALAPLVAWTQRAVCGATDVESDE